MAKLRDILGNSDSAEEHPKYRVWTSWMRRHPGGDPRVEIYRPRDLLGFKPAKLFFFILGRDGAPLESDEYEWDADLNQALVDLGVKATKPEKEMVRYALSLKESLAKPETRYGDGFFNSVLVELVKGIDFSDYPVMVELLRHVSALNPNRQSRSYSECQETIKAILAHKSRELRTALKYPDHVAEEVFVGALGGYLDERFSVTSRRKLGLLIGRDN